jgi:hypothetical protein
LDGKEMVNFLVDAGIGFLLFIAAAAVYMVYMIYKNLK